MAHLIAYLTSVSRHRRPGGSFAGQRSLAALLSAALALGAILPGAAFAAEADSEGEGSAPPEAVAEPGEEPDFEPGGEETVLEDLPAALAAQPGGGAEDTGDGAPVETEPAEDPEAPPPLPAEATGAVPDEVVEAEAPGSAEAPTAEVAAPEPEHAAPSPEPEAEAPAAATEPVENKPLVAPPSPPVEQAVQSSASSEEPTSTESSLSSTSPTEAEASPPRPVAIAPERGNGGGSLVGRRSHTVRPGESLWSIAKALLPASAGNAEIARKVQVLWRLNESRIGSGDPDVLPVGVELRLR